LLRKWKKNEWFYKINRNYLFYENDKMEINEKIDKFSEENKRKWIEFLEPTDNIPKYLYKLPFSVTTFC